VNGHSGLIGLCNRFVLAHNMARVCRRSRVICKQVSDYAVHCISSMTSIHSFSLPWDCLCLCLGFLPLYSRDLYMIAAVLQLVPCWLIHKLAHL